jgi:hypothetical protein
MAGRIFRSSASALWLGLAVGCCPVVASSAPLAMIDPIRQDDRQIVSPQALPQARSSRRTFTETGPVASAFGLY